LFGIDRACGAAAIDEADKRVTLTGYSRGETEVYNPYDTGPVTVVPPRVDIKIDLAPGSSIPELYRLAEKEGKDHPREWEMFTRKMKVEITEVIALSLRTWLKYQTDKSRAPIDLAPKPAQPPSVARPPVEGPIAP
jgi:hypothetical protein